MGRKPKFIMSDKEGAFLSKEVADYLREEEITPIITYTHAQFVERFIRTFKAMLNKRIEWDRSFGRETKSWDKYILGIMNAYNAGNEHSATGLTPSVAREPQSEIHVRMNLTLKQKRGRKYPELKVGNKVKLVVKTPHRKEHIPIFSDKIYSIDRIDKQHGLTLYMVGGTQRLRSEILKVT